MNLLLIAVVAFLPTIEVRGAIPMAYVIYHGNITGFWLGVIIAVAANIAIGPVALALLGSAERWLLRQEKGFLARLRNAYLGIIQRVERRKGIVERWGYVGLAAFVAVPLPGSGAWTGALLAHLLRLERRKAIISITAGVVLASILVLLGVEGVITLVGIAGLLK